ncbi:winged helix-turn-helix domain-containing protein [Limoniibacter endophyticus]|nr:crosslink repair DNA glycosylase YcaQ family protein [Limoniibacter endophyticus]
MVETITQTQARRIVLGAQGFTAGAPRTEPKKAHLMKVIDRLGLLQIDSVSVSVRAHYMPVFSRLGAYDQSMLDRAAAKAPRPIFEYWGHEASYLPVELQPLFRWRMEDAARGVGTWKGIARFACEQSAFIERIFSEIAKRGPLSPSDFEEKGQGGWWGWSDVKRAMEVLFWSGLITSAGRKGSMERLYDLPERVLPAAIIAAPTPAREDAQRALIARSAKSLGVASAQDLRDYYRLPVAGFAERLRELVDAKEIQEIYVKGWKGIFFLHRDASVPRRVEANTLLSPFDPLIFYRPRTERFFDFHYRIEIYTPAHKREYGYYVMPFLMDDRLAARVDLKADRKRRVLHVLSAFAEENAGEECAPRLLAALWKLARWQGLEAMEIADAGNLARRLKDANSA